MPPKHGQPIPAGCTKCGQQFLLPTDAYGNAIWTHRCPVELQEAQDKILERLERIEKALLEGSND
jgi:hypothetical protein